MVLLAAAFSLRFFRMGGVQKMVLGGLVSGFALYLMSKLTDDLSKAELITPLVAAKAVQQQCTAAAPLRVVAAQRPGTIMAPLDLGDARVEHEDVPRGRPQPAGEGDGVGDENNIYIQYEGLAQDVHVGVKTPLDSTYPTIAETLRDHGYATAGFAA